MAARCFARRHLIAVRGVSRGQQRRLLSSSLPTSRQTSTESPGVEVGQERGHQPGFFSSTHRISHAFQREGETSSEEVRPSSSASAAHPLIDELRSELYGKEVSASPERVWNLYMSIHQTANQALSDEASSSNAVIERPSLALTPRDHQAVLRAMTHKTKLESRIEEQGPSLVSYRYEGSLLNGGNMQNVNSYLQRVAFIFTQLRKAGRDELPNGHDYDHVLARLSPGGNMPGLTALWAQMTGKAIDKHATARQNRLAGRYPASEQSVRPTRLTYLHLMLGINRHLASQIQRAHRQHVTNSIWRGEGKKGKRKQAESALAASKGTARYGQQVAPQARFAVQLASTRTVSLFQDMIDRGLQPGKITLDLALRMLRMSGNLDGLRMLTRMAFAIDLQNPDSDPRKIDGTPDGPILNPNVDTLNTIVMAFGEQGTVSEMLSAYETLTRLLKLQRVEITEEEPQQTGSDSLFATDWRGIFRKGDEQTVESSRDTSAEVEEEERASSPHHPFTVLPNTTTLTTMIKHCCSAPDPSRMVAAPMGGTEKALRVKAEDHAMRNKGDYLAVASYLLTEAIDVQQFETSRMARQLGLEMPSSELIWERVKVQMRECEKRVMGEDGEIAKLKFIEDLVGEGGKTLVEETVGLQRAADFTPHFLPPGLAVNYDMIQPIVSHASKRRTADFTLWRTLMEKSGRALGTKVAELQILNRAIEEWESSRREQGAHPRLSNEALQAFTSALRAQRRLVQTQINDLGSRVVERMMQRFAKLRQGRRDRHYRRKERREAERMERQEAEEEEQKRRQRVAAEREERRLAAAEEAQHSLPDDAVLGVEPVHK